MIRIIIQFSIIENIFWNIFHQILTLLTHYQPVHDEIILLKSLKFSIRTTRFVVRTRSLSQKILQANISSDDNNKYEPKERVHGVSLLIKKWNAKVKILFAAKNRFIIWIGNI